MTPSARKEAIRRAEDAALKAASESRWDDAYSFLEIRRGLLKMDQDHLSAADSSAASGSVIPARPTIPAEGAGLPAWVLVNELVEQGQFYKRGDITEAQFISAVNHYVTQFTGQGEAR